MSPSVPTTTGVAARITVIDGQPTTTTQDIAAVYGKRHDRVLAIVRQRMAEAPEKWRFHNFVEALIERPQTGGGTVAYPVIRMTKKGFHFVVGKFTGAKAVQHQIAFADEFERMEADLKADAAKRLPEPSHSIDPRALLLGGKAHRPEVPMPRAVEQAINRQAWALAHDAYELLREHMARRVHYHHVHGHPTRAMHVPAALADIKAMTLGKALAHTAHTELSYVLSGIDIALSAAQAAKAHVQAQLASLAPPAHPGGHDSNPASTH